MSQHHASYLNRKMRKAARRGNMAMLDWYGERHLDRMYGTH